MGTLSLFRVISIFHLIQMLIQGPGYLPPYITRDENADAGFIIKHVEVNGRTQPYTLYVPPEYDPAVPWPMIVFLHGNGERGSDGWRHTDIGIGSAIRFYPEQFPCLVLMPQIPFGMVWGDRETRILGHSEDGTVFSDAAIEAVIQDYNVDVNRVSLTGLSMGGYGVWFYGAARNDFWSAVVPIAGGGRLSDADELAEVPVWAFHNRYDRTVEVDETRRMVAAVRAAGGDVLYTEFEARGHNAWDPAYANPAVINWMLSQTRDAVLNQ